MTQSPEHFIDLEWADLMGTLPKKRYDFIRALEKAQAAHPDLPLTPEKVGFAAVCDEEVCERLKVGMREYRELMAAKRIRSRLRRRFCSTLAGWGIMLRMDRSRCMTRFSTTDGLGRIRMDIRRSTRFTRSSSRLL